MSEDVDITMGLRRIASVRHRGDRFEAWATAEMTSEDQALGVFPSYRAAAQAIYEYEASRQIQTVAGE